jgi:hypothetical protein
MSDNLEKREFYSAIPWVYIDPEQARALPRGKLGLIEWAIAAYFLGIAILKFWWVLSVGGGLGIAVLNAIWPFLAGVGLALRVPWSIVMAMISTALTIYALVRGLGGDGSLITLAEMVANVGTLFYLIDGDRPNLIYRHRYRKYSVEDAAPVTQVENQTNSGN